MTALPPVLPSQPADGSGPVPAAPRWRRALRWALGLPPAYAGLLVLLLAAVCAQRRKVVGL